MFSAAKLPRFTESVQIDLGEMELEAAFDRITNVPPPEPSTPSVSSLPTPKLPERDTQRPDDTVQQALQYVSRTGIAFTQQPRWAYDAELDCVTLSESYLATAPDSRGNRFAIRCGAGLAVPVPANAMALSFLRTLELEFVKAQLLRDPAAMIFPFDGGCELHISSAEWYAEIVCAFGEK
jgi:hypothetical protein